MKIAIFYSGYLPGELYGGPVTSIYNFTELMGENNEIFIICTNHDLKSSVPYKGIKQGWNSVGKAHVMYLSDSEYNKTKFSEVLSETKPDLIYASSIFSVKQTYPLFDLSREKNIPLLLAPRGELNKNALSMKKCKKKAYILMLKAFKKLSDVYFQATSDEERNNIIQTLKSNEDKVFLLPNVPALPIQKENLKKKPGNLKICFVGRIVENKNLLIALNAVVLANSNVEFDIFGPIEDKDYYEKCQQIIVKAPSNVIIQYRGAVSPAKMRNIYSEYDCLISPTRFENYGQAIVEAMLNDVPVIISKGTTPWDDIEEKGAGFVVPIEDVKAYVSIIDALAEMDNPQYRTLISRLRAYCSIKFDNSLLQMKYQEIFKTIVDRR